MSFFRIGSHRISPHTVQNMPMATLRDQFYIIAKDWGISRKAHTPLSYIQAINTTAEARISREVKVAKLRRWLEVAESTVRHYPLGVSLEFERTFTATRTRVITLINSRLKLIPRTPEYIKDQQIKSEERRQAELERQRVEAEQLRIKQEQQQKRDNEMIALCQRLESCSLYGKRGTWSADDFTDRINKVAFQKVKDELCITVVKTWHDELKAISSERPDYFAYNDPFWCKFYWMHQNLTQLCATRVEEIEARDSSVASLCRQLSSIATQWKVDRVQHSGRAGRESYSISDIDYMKRIESNRWFFHIYDDATLVQQIIDIAEKSGTPRPKELSPTDPFWIQFSNTRTSIISAGKARLERIPGTPQYEYKERQVKAEAERQAKEKIRLHTQTQRNYYQSMIDATDRFNSFTRLCALPSYQFPSHSDTLNSTDYYKSFTDYFSKIETEGIAIIKSEKNVKRLTELYKSLEWYLGRSYETTKLKENTSFWTPYSNAQQSLSSAVKSQLESIPGTPEHTAKQRETKEQSLSTYHTTTPSTTSYTIHNTVSEHSFTDTIDPYSEDRVAAQNRIYAEAQQAKADAEAYALAKAREREAKGAYKSAQRYRDRIFDEANSGSYSNVGWGDVHAADKALSKAEKRYRKAKYL
jgi:hypothetical protein